ncbi:TetR/AcrR family transcriptional regulator [Sphingorhabdus sp.]|uniref:TetR/AcrR family transcriptional regulator n=1 Tax=Sphingorhabdus sp. TaxID=1902408 RepID=UPI00359374F6
MARPQLIDDAALIERLSHTFRAFGYEGASLTRLAKSAGMQKPSLYHRFPHGKRQMAEEVLTAARGWYVAHVFGPLARDGSPAERIAAVAQALDTFYEGGKQGCLLNLMAQPPGEDSPFAGPIREMFAALIDAFAAVAREAGLKPADAAEHAGRTVALLHGSLVLSRGLNSNAPFRAFTASLARELGISK